MTIPALRREDAFHDSCRWSECNGSAFLGPPAPLVPLLDPISIICGTSPPSLAPMAGDSIVSVVFFAASFLFWQRWRLASGWRDPTGNLVIREAISLRRSGPLLAPILFIAATAGGCVDTHCVRVSLGRVRGQGAWRNPTSTCHSLHFIDGRCFSKLSPISFQVVDPRQKRKEKQFHSHRMRKQRVKTKRAGLGTNASRPSLAALTLPTVSYHGAALGLSKI
jgi:hypothetical protein